MTLSSLFFHLFRLLFLLFLLYPAGAVRQAAVAAILLTFSAYTQAFWMQSLSCVKVSFAVNKLHKFLIFHTFDKKNEEYILFLILHCIPVKKVLYFQHYESTPGAGRYLFYEC